MSTPKQIAANKVNAQKSTGPKTRAGKTSTSKNAIKHGLLSAGTALPWENIDHLNELQARLLEAFSPEGELESILVDRITSLTWRLRRAGCIETGIFAWHRHNQSFDTSMAQAKANTRIVDAFDVTALFPPEEKILDQSAYSTAMNKALEQSALANAENPTLGRHFVEQADSFNKLHKYEIGLEKSLFKALHELQRLQAARGGSLVPPPIAVDVHGDIDV